MKADKQTRKANRAMRRKAAAHAAKTAKLLAMTAFNYTPGGSKVVAVEAPEAIAALTWAFTALLQNGCEPLAVRLKPETAAQFPEGDIDKIEGGTPYLAVGLDPDRRATYLVQYAKTVNTPPGAPASLADKMNREAVLRNLAPHLKCRGYTTTNPRDLF